MADDDYCAGTSRNTAGAGTSMSMSPADGPFAACVLCQSPTEYPESHKGITLCPVCEWQEAERTMCSG
ncbi:hypothetical protein [Streptomyces sp. NPDC015345]|uniref:hypothetical protein n=1 Tax=Streptomyces sp. NPDC015345 TaxID=3364953 RepID=UPI003700EB27